MLHPPELVERFRSDPELRARAEDRAAPWRDFSCALGNPQPSGEQVRQALMSLAAEGKVERDPSMVEPTLRGRSQKWKVSSNP